jgi:hypothetical protein
VVRRTERRVADQRMFGVDEARDRMDAGDLERLLLVERGQDAGQTAGQHRLPDSWGTGEQEVVLPGRGELERTTRALLPADVPKIE